MRIMLALAAAAWLIAILPPAHADEWCGFLDQKGSPVRCGFSSAAECKKAMDAQNAKKTICLPDPSFAAIFSRVQMAERN